MTQALFSLQGVTSPLSGDVISRHQHHFCHHSFLSLSQQHTHCLLVPVESPEGHTGEMLPIGTITLVIPAAVRALGQLGQLLDISHQTQLKG